MNLKQLPEDFIVNELLNLKDGGGLYSIFSLKKRNYTTEKAVQLIARTLKVLRKNIGYAGMKDRNAVTKQHISIYKVNKDRVEDLDLKDIELEFITHSNKPIVLGGLRGNSFEIVVRDLNKNVNINTEVKIKNLFDEQRFSNNNADIGKAIVKKNFKKAVELIVEGDGDYEQDVKAFIKLSPNNFIGALNMIPFKILLIFVHAYQSFIFNETVKQIDCKENVKIPLVGFGVEFEDKEVEKIIRKILKKEAVSERDFIIPSLPHLSCEGDERYLYITPSHLVIGKLEKDELNEKKFKVKISFSLPKGAYATNVIKQIVSE
ncbi:tRNA pseudouridine(13) synthase TruD [archaeon]|nr:tRNA pseudouridine(13) synthase TruD [archaeon]MBL7057389.1 tRNA pseudouridine(13) synthase TruD [Candidatus Woesearchaeota archaeon]